MPKKKEVQWKCLRKLEITNGEFAQVDLLNSFLAWCGSTNPASKLTGAEVDKLMCQWIAFKRAADMIYLWKAGKIKKAVCRKMVKRIEKELDKALA